MTDAGSSRHVHRRLFLLFNTLGGLLASILREGHSHAVLSLVLASHHGLPVRSALRLRHLVSIARSHTLIATNMLCIHQITKSLIRLLLDLEIVRFCTDKWQSVVVAGVLDAELALVVRCTVNHLGVVVVPLGLDLVLLKNVCWLAHLLGVLDGSHHVGASC